MEESKQQDFASVKDRLDEIVEAVSSDDMELEQALDLYEEAIKLGMEASSLLEEDIIGTEEDEPNAETEPTAEDEIEVQAGEESSEQGVNSGEFTDDPTPEELPNEA